MKRMNAHFQRTCYLQNQTWIVPIQKMPFMQLWYIDSAYYQWWAAVEATTVSVQYIYGRVTEPTLNLKSIIPASRNPEYVQCKMHCKRRSGFRTFLDESRLPIFIVTNPKWLLSQRAKCPLNAKLVWRCPHSLFNWRDNNTHVRPSFHEKWSFSIISHCDKSRTQCLQQAIHTHHQPRHAIGKSQHYLYPRTSVYATDIICFGPRIWKQYFGHGIGLPYMSYVDDGFTKSLKLCSFSADRQDILDHVLYQLTITCSFKAPWIIFSKTQRRTKRSKVFQ